MLSVHGVIMEKWLKSFSRQTDKIDIFIQKIAGPFASCKKHACDPG